MKFRPVSERALQQDANSWYSPSQATSMYSAPIVRRAGAYKPLPRVGSQPNMGDFATQPGEFVWQQEWHGRGAMNSSSLR